MGTEASTSSSVAAPVPVVPRRGQRILLVDDDAVLLSMLSARLERDGFAVHSATSGAQALANIDDGWPDLVILDLMMPGMDGEELAARVKRQVDLPIIVLSAIADAASKVQLIERWVDDYVTKPFDYTELLARIRRVLHRVGDRLPRREVRLGPDLTLILDRRECWVGGARVGLSPTETRLLTALVASLGDPVTTASLVARGWSDVEGVDPAHVWVTVRRLRQKIERDPDHPRYLLTERAVGYRLVAVTG
jgi:DNA-binding response OmpR family regulator